MKCSAGLASRNSLVLSEMQESNVGNPARRSPVKLRKAKIEHGTRNFGSGIATATVHSQNSGSTLLHREAAVNPADTFEIDERPREKPAFLRHWDWFFVLSVAWLLFDLFTQPVLSICIASLKFGWNDFANGTWLWLKDSNARRGRTCLVFYTATGLWRITVTTFAVTLLGLLAFGVWQALNPQAGAANGNQGKDDLLTGVSMMIVMLCFVLSSVSTWLAIWMGLKNRTRVWIDSTVRYSRRNGTWPPTPAGKNQLSRAVTSSLVFLSAILIGTAIGVLASAAKRAGPVPEWLIALPVVATIGCGVILLAGRSWLLRRLAATSARDCWSESGSPGRNWKRLLERQEFLDLNPEPHSDFNFGADA